MKCSDEYRINDDVLVHRSNTLIYLGTIGDIRNDLFLIKFDDGSTEWTESKRLQSFRANETKSLCVMCKKPNNEPIRHCCQCNRGFHSKCINQLTKIVQTQTQTQTQMQSQTKNQNQMKWCCPNCVPAIKIQYTKPHTDPRPTNNHIVPIKRQKYQTNNNKFPYDLDALTWDAHHRQNSEHIYCYCGKKGKWFLQMLQCVRCQQWFHAKCVKCISSPLYFGDRFYLFACAHCNHGVEFLRRLHMTIEDAVHLLLFNLTLHFSKRFYNLINVIFPYARDNWQALQLPPKLKNMQSNEVKDEIIKALKTHTDRFRADVEVKKKILNWALVSRAPPKAPHIVLPSGPLLTEKYINDLFYEQARINFMPQTLYNAVDVNCSDAKMKEFMYGKSVSAYINSLEASEGTGSSEDMDSTEDVLSSMDDDDLSEFSFHKDKDIDNDTTTIETIPNGDDSSLLRPLDGDSKLKKRGRPRFSLNDKPKDSIHDFNYSSDDTSSRGTLDSIIPPLENFTGMNNPFLIDNNNPRPFGALSNKCVTSFIKNGCNLQSDNGGISMATSIGGGGGGIVKTHHHIQLVRTVKRRLSANDIIVGPNMEVKRRKLNKKRMENVEVISTSALADLPKSATYLPRAPDSKRISLAAIRSSLKDLPIAKGKNGYKKHTITIDTNGFTEPIHLSSNSHMDSLSNTANSSLISSISSSPIKDTMKEESIADLQSSLNMYFGGVVNRIGNGETFTIKGKRILTDGRTQYLIGLDGVS